MNSTKEIKGVLVGAKFAASTVALLDEEAAKEGATRSFVLRRIVLSHYQDRIEQPVPSAAPMKVSA